MADPITVSDDEAASVLANGHPKSKPPSLHDGNPFPATSTGVGSAPGANGPATTGAIGPGGPLASC